MSARAIAIHGNEKSGERRANLEIKSECPALLIFKLLKLQVGDIWFGKTHSKDDLIYQSTATVTLGTKARK